jgi:hypothetical protein
VWGLRALVLNVPGRDFSEEIQIIQRVLDKLENTKRYSDKVISRLKVELETVKALQPNQTREALDRSEVYRKIECVKQQIKIEYLKRQIQNNKVGKDIDSRKLMKKWGLSKAAIKALHSPDFVPYNEEFCKNLPINQHCRASAHNACITSAKDLFGNAWSVMQQNMSLVELLTLGIRQLELDIAVGTEGSKDQGRIMICHAKYRKKEMQKKGPYESFHTKLWEITQWLDLNPDETLMINLDCLRDKNLTAEQINNELAAFSDYLYTPEDLEEFRKKNGSDAWPKPGEMNNKRLMVMYPESLLGKRFIEKENKKGPQDQSAKLNAVQEVKTFKRMSFEQDAIADSSVPGVATGVKKRVRGADKGAQNKLKQGPKPFFWLYHNSELPKTIPVFLYKVIRTLFIRPINYLFKTHLPDLKDEKLTRIKNTKKEIFTRVQKAQEMGITVTAIHMDDCHKFVANGCHANLNQMNAARAKKQAMASLSKTSPTSVAKEHDTPRPREEPKQEKSVQVAEHEPLNKGAISKYVKSPEPQTKGTNIFKK